MKKGKIYLIPNTLGESEIGHVIPRGVLDQINHLQYFIVEHSKSARAFLKKAEISLPQKALVIYELNKHTDPQEIFSFIEPIERGYDIGLISDAGCPGIADPGAEIVALAHRKDIEVVPLVGPSSILLAHMSSGMNGQSFAFNGYLPIDQGERKKMVQIFEQRAKKGQAQSFIETPYRNVKLFQELLKSCSAETNLCIAYDLTLEGQVVKTKRIKEWKRIGVPDFHKKPCIFILG
jgi:16S rRNA (cytidine1402-2'-O)-methyltransferase